MAEMTPEYIQRLKAEVSYAAFSNCFVYLPEFLEYVYRDPDHMLQRCKMLRVLSSEDDTPLMDVKYNRKHNTYKIQWVRPGFDIDRYWWMEAFTRLTLHLDSTYGIKDRSFRVYIDFNHVYNKEEDEKKIIFTTEDYNVPERWLK